MIRPSRPGPVLPLLAVLACSCGDESARDCLDTWRLQPLTTPQPVVVAAAHGATDSSLVLIWTSYGDPCTQEAAASFEIRMAADRATAHAWDGAKSLVQVFSPRGTGKREYYRVSGIEPGREYHFALRAVYADLGRFYQFEFSGATTACNVTLGQAPPRFVRKLDLPDLEPAGVYGSLAMDSDPWGHLYLARGLSVMKFSPDGVLLTRIGGEERAAGTAGIDFGLDGRLYVREQGGRILKYSEEGEYLGTVMETEPDPSWALGQMFAVDSRGQVFTANLFPDRIRKYSPAGTLVATWGSGERRVPRDLNPAAIAIDFNGGVYVADRYRGIIHRFTNDGRPTGSLGRPGGCPGEFHEIQDIRFGWDGALYTLETEEARIQKVSTDGTAVTVWGSPGRGAGEFEVPLSMAVGPWRTIYVFDNPASEGDGPAIHVFEAGAAAP